MSVAATIKQKLKAAFSPDHLKIIDESENHRGHGGWREHGETHFRIIIKARAFAGKSRIERHRMINDLLADEMNNPIHALTIQVTTPDETSD